MKQGFNIDQFSYNDGKNYLDVENHGEDGGVELKIEYDTSAGVYFDEKNWKELNKRVMKFFKKSK